MKTKVIISLWLGVGFSILASTNIEHSLYKTDGSLGWVEMITDNSVMVPL